MSRLTAAAGWLAAAAFLLAGACATAPPKELVEAREAFRTTNTKTIERLAPRELSEARVFMDRAEARMDRTGGDEPTADLAYLAMRRLQIAEAVAAGRYWAQQVAVESTRRREAGEIALAPPPGEEEEPQRVQAEAVQAPLGDLGEVTQGSRGVVIRVPRDRLFGPGKALSSGQVGDAVSRIADALRTAPGRTVEIEVHADARGSNEANHRMTRDMARQLHDRLVQEGLDASRVVYVGMGESQPIADNDTRQGREKNRRVEIIVQEPQVAGD